MMAGSDIVVAFRRGGGGYCERHELDFIGLRRAEAEIRDE
jgi:hypothetical protein